MTPAPLASAAPPGAAAAPRATPQGELDAALETLARHKDAWLAVPLPEQLMLLDSVREATDRVAERWVAAAVAAKGIPPGSPLEGEEWCSGPWALLFQVDHLSRTLRALHRGADLLEGVPLRTRPDGQVVARVHPSDRYDALLLSGVTAEVWMEPGVTEASLRDTMAVHHRRPPAGGKVALVLGAGNIASIPPLDALYKLFTERQVVLLKMNPVNAYLGPLLEEVFHAFVARGFLRVAYGGAPVGEYLTRHPAVDEVHVTGAARTHDAIVYGGGAEGEARKGRDAPLFTKRVTSELGGVGPTIVVPGPWTEADLAFQAEHVATQKMHNGGFNCVASQVLVLPRDWPRAEDFLRQVEGTFRRIEPRTPYYPGALERVAEAGRAHGGRVVSLDAEGRSPSRVLLRDVDAEGAAACFQDEFFSGALAQTWLPGADAESFLRRAVDFANTRLHGTLGANILIHPKTLAELGGRFEDILAGLQYGAIAVNAWVGAAFLLPRATWGAFPGHPRHDIQSGSGVVHNALMFSRAQRTVVRAPFAPFPRNLLAGERSVLPKPPWFVTHRQGAEVMRRLTRFAANPGPQHLPGIFAAALRG